MYIRIYNTVYIILANIQNHTFFLSHDQHVSEHPNEFVALVAASQV